MRPCVLEWLNRVKLQSCYVIIGLVKQRGYYDATVIRSGIGGLVTATQFAVKGAKFLVLEKYVIPGGSSGYYEQMVYIRFSLAAAFSLLLLTTTALPSSEIQALTAFKLPLHDPLGVLDGWDPSTPAAPCDWRDILCFDGRVRELRLPQLQLAGRLTPQLGELRQLRKLSLHSNNFNGSIPHSLSQCSLLRAVYLQHNSLSGDLPPSLLNLSNLQVFTVASNFLSGRIPSGFSVSLRFLDLSSNSLSGELPSNFSSDSQLQLLNLSFNNFSGEVPLSVEDNALRGLIPATIGSIPNLQVLSLSRNELSGSIPSSIFCNVRANISAGLRILELGFNALTGVAQPPDGGGGGGCASSLQRNWLSLRYLQVLVLRCTSGLMCRMPPKGKGKASASTSAPKKRKGPVGEASVELQDPPPMRSMDIPAEIREKIFDFEPASKAYQRFQVVEHLAPTRFGRLDILGSQQHEGWYDHLKDYADGAGLWPLLEFRLGGFLRVCSDDEFSYRLGFYALPATS
ncbi:Probable LRR receptor-like serine/threonine-protein kinase At4g36180 [Linum perenne]